MENQIFNSTLSDRRFASFHRIDDRKARRWGLVLAVFFSNWVLSGLVSSYGVLLAAEYDRGVPLWQLVITPGVYTVFWALADPWFRDSADSWGSFINPRKLAIIGTIMTFSGVLIGNWTEKIVHVLGYGLLGGIGTSLVLSQINFVISDIYQTNANKFKILGHYGQALGQSTMPYFFLVCIHFYGYKMSYLLFSCIVLQILPLMLFVKGSNLQKPRIFSKFGSYANYSLFTDNASINSTSVDVPLVDLSKKSWKSPSDEHLNQNNYENPYQNEDQSDVQNTPSLEIDERAKILFGIDILPQILEESEGEVDEIDCDKNGFSLLKSETITNSLEPNTINDDIKRLSVISDKFDEVIVKADIEELIEKESNATVKEIAPEVSTQIQKASVTVIDQGNSANRRESIQTFDWSNDINTNYSRNIFPKFSCGCSSYRYYRMKRATRNGLDYVNETFIRPFKLSLKTWQFYPSLLLKISSLCIPYCFSLLIALLGYALETRLQITEIALLISLHGIANLSFLILTPWMMKMKKSRFKYITAGGLFVAAGANFVILELRTFEFMAAGSLISGLGYGAISSTCEETSRNLIGLRKWSKLRGTLESVAALCVAIIAVLLSFFLTKQNGIEHCYGLITSLLFLSGLMWIFVPLCLTIREHPDVGNAWPHT